MTQRMRGFALSFIVLGLLTLVVVDIAGRRVRTPRLSYPIPHRHDTPMPGKTISTSLNPALYDCAFTLAPARTSRTACLRLEGGDGDNYTRLSFLPEAIEAAVVREGKAVTTAQAPFHAESGRAVALDVARRGEHLGVFAGDTLLLHAAAAPADGSKATVEAQGGQVRDLSLRPREPVIFADDFMRTADEPGAWETIGGSWRLQSAWDEDPHGKMVNQFASAQFAQNPFAWVGEGGKEPAWCLTGRDNWDDYTLTVAIRPERGTVGVGILLSDVRHGYRVRWTAANSRDDDGNTLLLERLDGERVTQLASSSGGYMPGDWYRLEVVVALDSIRVRVDGDERIQVPAAAPWHGKVGLYIGANSRAVFDDVTAYGSTLDQRLLAESAQRAIKSSFLTDRKGLMREWATWRNDWNWVGDRSVHRLTFYGDHWVTARVIAGGRRGELLLALGDGSTAVIAAAGDTLTYTLRRGNATLARVKGTPCRGGEEYVFRLSRVGARLALERDGEVVITADNPPDGGGGSPAFRAMGGFGQVLDVCALGSLFFDYNFTNAPVDWRGESGTWQPTVRWACQPQWSFYSGWGRGDAALWYKRRIDGDQTLQAFVAFKMEYPRERKYADEISRYHDLGMTICGDGRDPRTGYSVLTGLPDVYDTPNRFSVLYRNGVEVARAAIRTQGRSGMHFRWHDLELRKRGDTVLFTFKGDPALTFRDPHPIDGGVPAIWVSDNAISIARARLTCASPPQPRRDPRLFLDRPWFPEWIDVGKPLTLDFPRAFATTGRPVSLTVRTRMAPSDDRPPVMRDRRLHFTANTAGERWYQVTAASGEHASAPYDVFFTVFNAARRRDDSHAVALYYFNEGKGTTVRDHSAVRPALDLQLPADAAIAWLPGQGLSTRGRTPLRSGPAQKLMALKTARAATLEFWVSTHTAYSSDHWLSALLAWEKKGQARNFLAGIHMNTAIFVPPAGNFAHGYGLYMDNNPEVTGSMVTEGICSCLQHLVFTWDGTATRLYIDGKLAGTQNIPWSPERWQADAPLLLGNQQDNQRTYLGAYYLVAIHDRCLTPAQIKRHYEAGPGARDQ